MSDIAIRVEHLSKRYRLGERVPYKSLREELARTAAAPLGWLGGKKPVSRGAGYIWALDDISFEIKEGEAVGIIGRNGAGKSTLLKILSRITKPTKGNADIYGRVGSLLEVGTGFHPELTGRENIYLNGAILGMKRNEIDRKFDEIVAFAEMEKFLDTPVKRYSSGMYMRLAFSVAAHLEPEILLIDEVLAVGDAQFQKKCLGKMGEVANQGRTVLFVSHNMVAIEGLCTRSMVLRSGSIVFFGKSYDGIKFYRKELEKYQNVPLDQREDRQGEGKVRVGDIKIKNEADEIVDSIMMGDSFAVELELNGNLKSGIIGVLIGNEIRNQLIRGYTWENLKETIKMSGQNRIRCHFNNFPLIHGEYDIHIWIAELEGNHINLQDFVENAAKLVINPVDMYGNGRILDSTRNIAFCQVSWEIISKGK